MFSKCPKDEKCLIYYHCLWDASGKYGISGCGQSKELTPSSSDAKKQGEIKAAVFIALLKVFCYS